MATQPTDAATACRGLESKRPRKQVALWLLGRRGSFIHSCHPSKMRVLARGRGLAKLSVWNAFEVVPNSGAVPMTNRDAPCLHESTCASSIVAAPTETRSWPASVEVS